MRFRTAAVCLALCAWLSVAAKVSAQAGPPASTAPSAPASRPATVAGPASLARREITALIAALGASGCEFQRNGRWYDAATARAHLQRKYEYLRKRDLAPTAELFIERAASRSSMSGKPYRVRCPGRAEQPSADWFLQRLRAVRARSG